MSSKFAFAFWFPILATAVLVAGLSLSSLAPVQSGPGGLTALGNIPNYIALLICSFFGLSCIIFRPKPLISSRIIAILTLLLYAIAVYAFTASPIVGSYALKVLVLDANGKPIPNVYLTVSLSRSFSSLPGLFSSESTTDIYTDKDGAFVIHANWGQNVYVSINPTWHRLSPYRYASFQLEPRKDGRFSIQQSWSNRDFDQNENMHFRTSNNADLPSELKVFLPIDGGKDTNPFP